MNLNIIIIEYYCMDHVEACVHSIREHLGNRIAGCLVLSNSEYSEQELREYKARLGGISFVRAPRNLGYAGGVNAALKVLVDSDYVYILNPDCLLTDDKVIALIEKMESDNSWAIAGPKIVDEDGEVQPSCRRFPKPWTFLLARSMFSRLPGAYREQDRYFMRDYDRLVQREVDWVSGGAMIVKTAALEQIGGMDERYFLYMEDVDWCHASWLNGFKVGYVPESVVIHAGKHRSIQAGLTGILSRHVRMHLSSMFKYFRKYGMSTPDTRV